MGRYNYSDHVEYDDDELEGEQEEEHWELITREPDFSPVVPPASPSEEEEEEQDQPQNESNMRSWNGDNSPMYFTFHHPQHGEWRIYATPHVPPQKERTRKRFMWSMVLSVVVLLVALCIRDLPPAPPVSSMGGDSQLITWRNYLATHTKNLLESLSALVYHVPFHVLQWWLTGLFIDLQIQYHKWTRSPPCSLQISSAEMFQKLDEYVIGQEEALSVVSDAIQAWQPNQTPLLLFFTGYKSSGKRHVAQTLAQQIFFEHCTDISDIILFLEGRDFVINRHQRFEGAVRLDLTHKILRHFHLHSGSLIFLEEVENMSPDIAVWLLNELSSLSSTLHKLAIGSVIVLSSDSIGRASITRGLRTFGSLAESNPGLTADMTHEIDKYFGRTVGSSFDALVPFGPLSQQHLFQVFRLRVERYSQLKVQSIWRKFTITNESVAAFLDEKHVEYLQWKRRDQESDIALHIMTVSMDGARVINDNSRIWTKLVAQVNRCLVSNPQPNATAVLDYQHSHQKAFFLWCKDDRGPTQLGDCTEVCNFPI